MPPWMPSGNDGVYSGHPSMSAAVIGKCARDHCSHCVTAAAVSPSSRPCHVSRPSSAALRGRKVRIRSVSGRVRYAGLRNPVRVTDGHEAAAKAAQLRKRPNRIGLFFLRLLGFRGQVARSTSWGGHAGPSRERPVRHEHSAPGE